VIEDGNAGYAQGFLWLWFTGYTMPQAAAILFDPSKTARIIYQYGEMQDEYTGYTNCTNISIDTDGQIAACMTKGDESNV
jgi:hypothetical protein